MRKTDPDKHEALAQMLGLAVIIAVVTGASDWENQRPADATRVSLPISELRSQSAELQALSDERQAGNLDDRFVRAHTQQLLDNHLDSREELTELQPLPDLLGAQRDAEDAGASLQQQLEAVEGGGSADERDIEALRDRFRGRERELRN
jgi:hypothetical protein